MATTILVVDDSQVERLLVEGLLINLPDVRVELAENGRDALAAIALDPPDLVVSDLVMPEMDGLELVREMRRRHPDIPVILMTAHGDETTALDALEAGAASYVPKSRQAECLPETVRRVIERAAVERDRVRLEECVLEYHCRFALENDPRLIRALVEHVQQVMAGQGFGDTIERIRMGEALEEALLNAMFHGNLEIDEPELARARAALDDRLMLRLVEERCREEHIQGRRILVVVHVTEKEARFVIRDEGRGFFLSAAQTGNVADRFGKGRNRGLTLIHALMDHVSYNNAGNELVMKKLRQAAVAV